MCSRAFYVGARPLDISRYSRRESCCDDRFGVRKKAHGQKS